jgi:hypothetical protein
VSRGIGDVGLTLQWIHDLTSWTGFVMQRWSNGLHSFNPTDPAQTGAQHFSDLMSVPLHPLCGLEHGSSGGRRL